MRNIKCGEKACSDGVLFTLSEYAEYEKLLRTIQAFKSYKKDYDLSYKSGYK